MVAQIPAPITPRDEDYVRPWFLIVLQRGAAVRPGPALGRAVNAPLIDAPCAGSRGADRRPRSRSARRRRAVERLFDLALLALAARRRAVALSLFIRASVAVAEIGWVFLLGLITAIRVLVLIVLASLIWVPIGVWIGLRPRLADGRSRSCSSSPRFRPICSFRSAVVLILQLPAQPRDLAQPADDPRDAMVHPVQRHRRHAPALPRDLQLRRAATSACGGSLWWRRVMLPAIFPAYVTGAVTAAGGSWNASIVVRGRAMGRHHACARPASAPTSRSYTADGDAARIALGIGVLCLYVLAFNRLLWRRLYDLAAERLRLD